MWRYAPGAAAARTGIHCLAGRRHDAPVRTRRLGARLGADDLWVKDEGLNPDRLVQSPRPVLRRLHGGRAGHQESWRFPRPETPPAPWPPMPRRPESKRTSSCRATCRKSNYIECKAFGAHVTLVDGLISDCAKIVDEAPRHRRLVRRQHAQGALPHRRQEDHGLRGGRAVGLGAARRDLLSHRRRRRHHRHVEGVR